MYCSGFHTLLSLSLVGKTNVWNVLDFSDREKFEFQDGKRKMIVKNVTKSGDIACFRCVVENSVGETVGDGCLNVICKFFASSVVICNSIDSVCVCVCVCV